MVCCRQHATFGGQRAFFGLRGNSFQCFDLEGAEPGVDFQQLAHKGHFVVQQALNGIAVARCGVICCNCQFKHHVVHCACKQSVCFLSRRQHSGLIHFSSSGAAGHCGAHALCDGGNICSNHLASVSAFQSGESGIQTAASGGGKIVEDRAGGSVRCGGNSQRHTGQEIDLCAGFQDRLKGGKFVFRQIKEGVFDGFHGAFTLQGNVEIGVIRNFQQNGLHIHNQILQILRHGVHAVRVLKHHTPRLNGRCQLGGDRCDLSIKLFSQIFRQNLNGPAQGVRGCLNLRIRVGKFSGVPRCQNRDHGVFGFACGLDESIAALQLWQIIGGHGHHRRRDPLKRLKRQRTSKANHDRKSDQNEGDLSANTRQHIQTAKKCLAKLAIHFEPSEFSMA